MALQVLAEIGNAESSWKPFSLDSGCATYSGAGRSTPKPESL